MKQSNECRGWMHKYFPCSHTLTFWLEISLTTFRSAPVTFVLVGRSAEPMHFCALRTKNVHKDWALNSCLIYRQRENRYSGLVFDSNAKRFIDRTYLNKWSVKLCPGRGMDISAQLIVQATIQWVSDIQCCSVVRMAPSPPCSNVLVCRTCPAFVLCK